MMEEFETFGGRKDRFADDEDSDSEDDRVPNALVIRLNT